MVLMIAVLFLCLIYLSAFATMKMATLVFGFTHECLLGLAVTVRLLFDVVQQIARLRDSTYCKMV